MMYFLFLTYDPKTKLSKPTEPPKINVDAFGNFKCENFKANN